MLISYWSRYDPQLPSGWKYYDNGRGCTIFKDEHGLRFTNRRKVLAHMYRVGGFSRETIYYIRDGLLDEGWFYHQDLPPSWMYKQYNHKIEGVGTDILYILSPRGVIYRSKLKIKRHARELGLSDFDLELLLNFKSEICDVTRKVDDPDSDWIYDERYVPFGWRRKKYSYNSGITKKTEEVFHYLTPDNFVLRGKKQVYDYMVKNGCFNIKEFEKFHFNRKSATQTKATKEKLLVRRRNKVDWGDWKTADELGEGWTSRMCYYNSQKKVQYRAPDTGRKFQSRVLAVKYINAVDGEVSFSHKTRRGVKNRESVVRFKNNGNSSTIWDEWRSDEIPCLDGWQFSIGRRGSQRKIRYKSPSGNVFRSRGPLLRYLKEKGLKSREQLAILKKQLKTNQNLSIQELLQNDKFIKNFDADINYLEFIKIRYENESHKDIPEVIDPKLPRGWVKKVINGVDYFKDPTGRHVFNSRRLVVDHLSRNYYDVSRSQLQSILDDSDTESDLTDSDQPEDQEDVNCEENNNFEFVSC